MNAEYINIFIHSAQSVLNSVCHESPKLGKVFIKNRDEAIDSITISVGLIGDLNGTIVYSMNNEAGFYIATKMMMGMPVNSWDTMSSSALNELCNMISGRVSSKLSSLQKETDITTPTFANDKEGNDANMQKFTEGKAIFCLPLIFENGQVFNINVQLKEE